MKTRVITLNDSTFATNCRRLQEIVEQSNFVPHLVVGIRQGGVRVSTQLFPHVPHVEVTMRRPTTARKEHMPMRWLQHLPYAVLNALRIAEARWLNRHKPEAYPEGTMPAEVPLLPRRPADTMERERILIADDAVDSGRTLELVTRWLQSVRPEADIRAAVITVTTPAPLVMPQYYCYYPNTLIRFPWSKDYKRAR